MTSKLKCPVCNVPLTECVDWLFCPNDHCAWAGNAELWKALIQSQKDLETAVDALNAIIATPLNSRVIHDTANNALKQIEHKE